MVVNIDGETYYQNRKQFRATLKVARSAVPHGIYAAARDGVCVIIKRKIESKYYLRKEVKNLQDRGFKVYWNE